MPKVQNNIDETERYDLKSALPDGYVVLRRLTYGQVIRRRALTKLSMAMEKGNKDFKGEMALGSVEINNFEFATCIVEHNLEKNDGTKFNFANPVDLQMLDPRVGTEIELFISKMNNLDEDEGEYKPVSTEV